MPHEVFISYSSKDSDVANMVCAALEGRGIQCWIASRDVGAGVNYPTAIIDAIKNARVGVLIFSSNALKSDHVSSEMLAAFNRQIPVVPFRIEDVEPTEEMEYLLGLKHWVDASGGLLDEYMDRLANGVQERLREKAGEAAHWVSGPWWGMSRRVGTTVRSSRSWLVYFLAVLASALTLIALRGELDQLTGGNPWLSMVIGLFPLVLVLPEAVSQRNQRLIRRRMQIEGVSGILRDPEYFRTDPYDTIPDYMKYFRADMAHVKVLEWITRSDEPLLFLTGRSGTGKTSILNAYIRPELEKKDPPFKTVLVRAFGYPVEDLRKQLIRLMVDDAHPPGDEKDILTLLRQASKVSTPGRLLVILDQFEEMLIIHERDPERLQRIKDLLISLATDPIPGLTVLLSLRSDYFPLLESFDLPPLRSRENWFEVGAFSETHSRRFLKASPVPFSDESVTAVFKQIAAFEGSEGLVRPIILNMIGLIVSKSEKLIQAVQRKLTENLVIEYLRDRVFRRDMREHAPHVLEQMITDAGTKTPQSVADLSATTGIPKGEVLGCLYELGNEGLVRRVDIEDEVWEIAHDFIAHHVLLMLRSTRRPVMEIIRPWLAPVALVCWAMVVVSYLPPYITDLQERRIFQTITDAGGAVEIDVNGEVSVEFAGFPIAVPSQYNPELLDKPLERMSNLRSLTSLTLSNCEMGDESLAHLSGLTSLEYLTLSSNWIRGEGLAHLSGLTSLEHLNLGGNQIGDEGLACLSGLTSLESLHLGGNQIGDEGLVYLSGLTSLEGLYLTTNQIGDEGLAHLSGLTSLEILYLATNQISDEGLVYLSGLTSLKELVLHDNDITDKGLAHLSGLTSLLKLALGYNDIGDEGLAHLSDLTSLKILNLDDCSINGEGLAYLSDLTSLEALQIAGNSIGDEDLAHLSSLTSLILLILDSNDITGEGLVHLSGLTSLERLRLNRNKISDEGLAHLTGLPSLVELHLAVNNITGEGLVHLAGLTSLRELNLSPPISEDALANLRQMLPNATIHWEQW